MIRMNPLAPSRLAQQLIETPLEPKNQNTIIELITQLATQVEKQPPQFTSELNNTLFTYLVSFGDLSEGEKGCVGEPAFYRDTLLSLMSMTLTPAITDRKKLVQQMLRRMGWQLNEKQIRSVAKTDELLIRLIDYCQQALHDRAVDFDMFEVNINKVIDGKQLAIWLNTFNRLKKEIEDYPHWETRAAWRLVREPLTFLTGEQGAQQEKTIYLTKKVKDIYTCLLDIVSIDIHEHLAYLPDQRCFVANKSAPCCLVERNFALHRLAGENHYHSFDEHYGGISAAFFAPPNGQTAIIV